MMSIVSLLFACQSSVTTPLPEVGEVWEMEMGRAEFVEPSNPVITVFANLSEIQTGDLVITEVMHTPQQTPYDSYGEWIEIYNAGEVAVDLNGLELSSSNDAGVTFSNSLVVGAGEYVLLGTRTGQNGGLVFDGLYSAGSIRHGINDDLSIGYSGLVFDSVSWTRDLAAVTDGHSLALDGDDLDSVLNDSEYRWYAGQTAYGDGDYGTPGSANLPVYMGSELNAGDLVITEIMHNPTTVWDSRGEWFEVQNRTDGIVQLYGLSVGSTGDAGFTSDSNAWLSVEGFGVFAARAGETVNGGVSVDEAYFFGDFKLGQSDAITLTSNNGVVDEVSYNKFSWGQFNGVSLSLSPVASDEVDNDTARFWCAGSSAYGDGDLGTPGSINADCANLDYDGDGYTLEDGDCNDESEFALPTGGVEVCDSIDNDCDGLVDDDDDSVVYSEDDSWYLDIDGDGYGGLYSIPVVQCETPVGGMDNPYVDNADDCDDLDATTIWDKDCDGVLTEDDCDDLDANSTIVVEDADCDGVLTADDCDDADATLLAQSNDADCDGAVMADDCDDSDSSDASLSGDCDQDGSATVDDCDDFDATVYPGASEIAGDGIDQDCDGVDPSACGWSNCYTHLDLGGGYSMDLVLIPNGTFTMGSPINEEGRQSDEVQHQVTLSKDYYVMTTEVTQGMFDQIMGYQSYGDQSSLSGVGYNYPAYYVSWHMAADFANKVTQRHNALVGTNLQECYSCSGTTTGVICSVSVNPYQCTGYRMLTEAEWEYAARAGTTEAFWTPNGGGNLPSGYSSTTSTLTDGFDLRLYGHYYATYNNPYGSKEVAQLLPNDYGLYDMSGNLFEWVQDWYGAYSTGSLTNPTGVSSSFGRVARGGYWHMYQYFMRSAMRSGTEPTYRGDDIGFRLALGLLTQPSKATIAISNQAPEEGVEDLYCEILVDSIDSQGDEITYTFEWIVDGATYNGTPTTTVYNGDTIPASETVAWEVWECLVTPNDGTENGFISSDIVMVRNACSLTNCETNLDLGGGQSIDMVLIPSGSDPLGRYDITSDFYLMTTEVTQGMFTALMSYDPTTYSTTYGVGNDYPVYYVNWHMAADFANKVTQRHNSMNGTSLQECYSCSSSGSTSVTCTEAVNPYQCSGYVLPTEAEWEYAARSGTQYDFWTPDGGGNYSADTVTGNETIVDGVSNPLLIDYAWYGGNNDNQYGRIGSKEVGQKFPNGFGLYDMYGNMWEWTTDWSDCSFPQTSIDPYCGSVSSSRIGRGGLWYDGPDYLRASSRTYLPPTSRNFGYGHGFRLGLHP